MKSLLLAVAVAQGGGGAAADPFCEDVRTLAAAAEEPSPFRALHERDFAARLGRAHCFFGDGRRYRCGHSLATDQETPASYAARIRACLPGAELVRRAGDAGPFIVRHGRLLAQVSETGTDRSHVGRSIRILFEAVDPGAKGAGTDED